MKKPSKRTLFLLSIICLFILLIGATDNPEPQYTIDTPYEYPILPGTQEWIDLGDTLTRRRACQIPDEVLTNLTTDALLQTVLNYPFLCDIYSFNTFEIGYETVKRRFNGLQELETRPDYLDLLQRYCQDGYSLSKTKKSLGDYVAEDLYSIIYTEIDDTESTIFPYALPRITTVYTPKGSPVEAAEGRVFGVKYTEIDSNKYDQDTMAAAIENDKRAYPQASLLRGVTHENLPSYNCTSYALYSQSYNNNIWLGLANSNGTGPWTYFTDGSYDLVVRDYPATYGSDNLISPRGNAQVGDVFVYGFNESTYPYGPHHIGIVNSLKFGTGVNKVVSKWGAGGLWLHTWSDCPYIEETGYNYSIWRLAE
ncbi:CHAP domain-containing protein [Lawsonibacter sp. JLR.KK007]|jgi:hypothetical protein|uniref:CHAP domain-containing protein n=1 Tax=Lawsonibacter sp. JLR.KK007 TaxID=3114293 RepID=UPI002FF325A6